MDDKLVKLINVVYINIRMVFESKNWEGGANLQKNWSKIDYPYL